MRYLKEALPESATYERDLGPNEVWVTADRQYLVAKGTREVLNAVPRLGVK